MDCCREGAPERAEIAGVQGNLNSGLGLEEAHKHKTDAQATQKSLHRRKIYRVGTRPRECHGHVYRFTDLLPLHGPEEEAEGSTSAWFRQ